VNGKAPSRGVGWWRAIAAASPLLVNRLLNAGERIEYVK